MVWSSRQQERTSPPSYTSRVQSNPTFFTSDTESSITESSMSPSDSASARPSPSRHLRSSMYPSLVNERSGLIPNAHGTEGYQSVPPSSPPKLRRSPLSGVILILLTAIALSGLVMLCRDPLDLASRETIRKQWDLERWAHQVFINHTEFVRAQWLVERQEHDRQRSSMVIERQSWQVEREEQETQLGELRQRIEQGRWDWDAEKQNHERDREQWRKRRIEDELEWEKKRQMEDVERKRRQIEFEKELERKRKIEDEEQRKRQAEYERKRRMEDAERRRREEEDRKRAGLRWETPGPNERCMRYGTREYTARLSNIPQGYDRMKGCRETEAEIHGNLMKPDYCEDKGWDGVWGKWIVDFHEPTCTTWWSNLSDKGCTAQGSRIRRFEQHLENIQSGDNWKQMCSTAPTDFHSHHFNTPTSCANWAGHGIYGYWDVPDSSC